MVHPRLGQFMPQLSKASLTCNQSTCKHKALTFYGTLKQRETKGAPSPCGTLGIWARGTRKVISGRFALHESPGAAQPDAPDPACSKFASSEAMADTAAWPPEQCQASGLGAPSQNPTSEKPRGKQGETTYAFSLPGLMGPKTVSRCLIYH